VGELCPKCKIGTLLGRRGRFGPFAGCDRYPDCDYIHRTGPPPPPPLPFDVECPKCGKGTLTTRRARRTGNVFYGCGRYPDCDFTTNMEPLGALHDADGGPVALKDESGICLKCGASVDLPADRAAMVGQKLPGGPPNPEALAPSRGRRGAKGKGKAKAKAKGKKASSDQMTTTAGSPETSQADAAPAP
jgi:ssDNA-binding Zn-finger/Zn-ribbon topoisomerase 1